MTAQLQYDLLPKFNHSLAYKIRLSTVDRIFYRQKTECTWCHEDITDDFFIAGCCKIGSKTVMLHEKCMEATNV